MINAAQLVNVSPADIDKFVESFYKEERGDIDLRAFVRIYDKMNQ